MPTVKMYTEHAETHRRGDWRGATTREANRNAHISFLVNPASLAPTYGGYVRSGGCTLQPYIGSAVAGNLQARPAVAETQNFERLCNYNFERLCNYNFERLCNVSKSSNCKTNSIFFKKRLSF